MITRSIVRVSALGGVFLLVGVAAAYMALGAAASPHPRRASFRAGRRASARPGAFLAHGSRSSGRGLTEARNGRVAERGGTAAQTSAGAGTGRQAAAPSPSSGLQAGAGAGTRQTRAVAQPSPAPTSSRPAVPQPNSASLPSAGGSLSFNANFASGSYAPFKPAQCSNTGTPSKSPRQRGILNVVSTASARLPPAAGADIAEIVDPPLPSNLAGQGYAFVTCAMLTPLHPLPLGQTLYYGLMIYEPTGWSLPNKYWGGTNIEEFQFQGVDGAPITFQLHGNESPLGPHVTLALETGVCNTSGTGVNFGCAYRSNADNVCTAPAPATCLPAYYAIPPNGVSGSPGFVEGQWNEIVMAVNWESSGGSIQTWYRVAGASTWNQGSSVTNIPTVQWRTGTSPSGNALEETESYTTSVSSPFTVSLDNDLEGSSLGVVEAAMP